MKNLIAVPNGLIPLDSDFAAYYGFTSEHFYEETFLVGDTSLRQVLITMLISNRPGEGHFSKAVKKMLEDDIRVIIQTPVPKMQEILTVWGFDVVWKPEEGVEYWVYPPYEAKG
jgi:hypothetical protein